MLLPQKPQGYCWLTIWEGESYKTSWNFVVERDHSGQLIRYSNLRNDARGVKCLVQVHTVNKGCQSLHYSLGFWIFRSKLFSLHHQKSENFCRKNSGPGNIRTTKLKKNKTPQIPQLFSGYVWPLITCQTGIVYWLSWEHFVFLLWICNILLSFPG